MRGGLDRVGCARDWTFQVMSNSKLNPHPRNNYYFATPTTYYLPTETARVVCLWLVVSVMAFMRHLLAERKGGKRGSLDPFVGERSASR